MNKVLVIGYGNSLAGDDALGFNIVSIISGEIGSKGIDVKYVHQLMPEHAAEVAEYDMVIFIDAETGGKPGTMHVREIKKCHLHDTSAAAHEYTLDSILLLSEKLYSALPKVYLITVTGSNFDLGEKLSREVAARVPDVLKEINNIIEKESTRGVAEYA